MSKGRHLTRLRLAICSSGELFGGVEEHIVTLARQMSAREGIETMVVLFHHGVLQERLLALGIDTHVLADRVKYDPFTIFRVAKLFRRQRTNLVHTHGYLATCACGPAAKMCGAGLIKTEHGAMEPMGSSLGRAKMKINLALDSAVSRWLADRVVYVSKDLAGRLSKWRRHDGEIIILNGIDPPVEEDIAAAEIGCGGRFNVGIIGRLSEVKGHAILFRAVARLTDCPGLTVHVFGTGRLAESLQSEAFRLGLQGRVHFHGFRTDILACLKALDAVAMPSLHEGIPYSLLQAMSLGVPVVASRVGGLEEVLEDGRDAILAKPGDVDAVAEALRKLYGDRALGRELGQRARAKVLANHSADTMAEKYLALYREVIPRE